ncbi:Cyclic nucleotide-binding domain-containing protein [Psidium guajava]|nr:Cyclic nucleotide-binding domain-containing protein [Psidium guajava]
MVELEPVWWINPWSPHGDTCKKDLVHVEGLGVCKKDLCL